MKRLFRNKTRNVSSIRMAHSMGDAFYAWDGKVYNSAVVRSCIRPRTQAIGKLVPTHVRKYTDEETGKKVTKVWPAIHMKFLLEEPNPYMSGQKLLERMANQLAISRNAFALIVRDENDIPMQILPIPCSSAEAVYDDQNRLYIKFLMPDGRQYTFPYTEVIHVAEDVQAGTVFGTPVMQALTPLMEIVTTTEQGIVKAIKASAVIRWLLKFNQGMRPEDIKAYTKMFSDSYLNIDEGTGVAGVDTKVDAVQVKNDNFTPNAAQQDRTKTAIMDLFQTNEKIISSSWSEDDWAAYFEAEIEPALVAFQNEFTRKLFTRRERGFGNMIYFDAQGIDSETTRTKLSYIPLMDRGAMTANEMREKFHWAPIEGGDEPRYWQDPKNRGGQGDGES